MLGLETDARHAGLEHTLLELMNTRVSPINRCTLCLDMHTQDARADSESEQRLYVLPAWREAPFFSDRERAALAWAEALSALPTNDVGDELYNEARKHFSEKELVDLTFAIIAINGWNRLAVSFRMQDGTYQPAARK